MAEQVLNGEIDVGLLRVPEYFPKNIYVQELSKESWFVAVHKNHSLARMAQINIKNIAKENLIFYPRYNNPAGYDDVMEMFRANGVKLNIYQEAPEQMTIAGLVAAGMGVAIVPECMARIKVNGVVHRPLQEGRGRTGFAIICRKENDILVKQFLSIVAEPPHPTSARR
jgi:DNA-binding transcriptional LysR family regulator